MVVGQEDWVRKHLNKLDTLEPMGAGTVHSQALRELADQLRLFLITLKCPGVWERYLRSGRKKNVTPCLQEGGSGELQASQPHLDPQEDDGKTHPGDRFQPYEEQAGD